MRYVIQVSNHPGAGKRIPTQAAAESWVTLKDGEFTAASVRAAIDGLAGKWYRHARAFKGMRLWYAVLDMAEGGDTDK